MRRDDTDIEGRSRSLSNGNASAPPKFNRDSEGGSNGLKRQLEPSTQRSARSSDDPSSKYSKSGHGGKRTPVPGKQEPKDTDHLKSSSKSLTPSNTQNGSVRAPSSKAPQVANVTTQNSPKTAKRKRTLEAELTTDTGLLLLRKLIIFCVLNAALDGDTTDFPLPTIKSKEDYALIERQFHKKYKEYMSIRKQIESKSQREHFNDLKDQLIRVKGTEEETRVRERIINEYKKLKGESIESNVKQWKKLHTELKILKSSLWAAYKPIYGDSELSSPLLS
jgi:hypothetical protein